MKEIIKENKGCNIQPKPHSAWSPPKRKPKVVVPRSVDTHLHHHRYRAEGHEHNAKLKVTQHSS